MSDVNVKIIVRLKYSILIQIPPESMNELRGLGLRVKCNDVTKIQIPQESMNELRGLGLRVKCNDI